MITLLLAVFLAPQYYKPIKVKPPVGTGNEGTTVMWFGCHADDILGHLENGAFIPSPNQSFDPKDPRESHPGWDWECQVKQ